MALPAKFTLHFEALPTGEYRMTSLQAKSLDRKGRTLNGLLGNAPLYLADALAYEAAQKAKAQQAAAS